MRSFRWLALSAMLCWGGVCFGSGERAFSSLRIPVGAAESGMGRLGASSSVGASSLYWNPAGLALGSGTEILASSNAWALDVHRSAFALSHPFSDRFAGGAFVSYLDYGEIVRRDADGEASGAFRPYDLAAGAGVAFAVGGGAYGGLTAKVLSQAIDGDSMGGLAFDAGVRLEDAAAALGGRVSLGVSLQHAGGGVGFGEERFPLPTGVRFGGAFRFGGGSLAALEGSFPFGGGSSASFGADLGVWEPLRLRAGYRYPFGGNDLGFWSGLSAGLGLRLEPFALDYALERLGSLGPSNRISLSGLF